MELNTLKQSSKSSESSESNEATEANSTRLNLNVFPDMGTWLWGDHLQGEDRFWRPLVITLPILQLQSHMCSQLWYPGSYLSSQVLSVEWSQWSQVISVDWLWRDSWGSLAESADSLQPIVISCPLHLSYERWQYCWVVFIVYSVESTQHFFTFRLVPHQNSQKGTWLNLSRIHLSFAQICEDGRCELGAGKKNLHFVQLPIKTLP